MTSNHSSTPTSSRILLEDGSVLNPVASLKSPAGTKAHIVLEEGNYVLFIENMAGISTKTMWIFPEAHRVLQRLPPPSKTKNQETELAIAVRSLTTSEAGSPELELAASDVFRLIPKSAKEALSQIVEQGPLYDGDVISKQARDQLLSLGLVCRIAMNGTHGWNAANYFGFKVHKSHADQAVPAS